MTDMLEGVPDARHRAPHISSDLLRSPPVPAKFTMFFPKSSLEFVAKIPPWFATKQFPQRSNIPSKMHDVICTLNYDTGNNFTGELRQGDYAFLINYGA